MCKYFYIFKHIYICILIYNCIYIYMLIHIYTAIEKYTDFIKKFKRNAYDLCVRLIVYFIDLYYKARQLNILLFNDLCFFYMLLVMF